MYIRRPYTPFPVRDIIIRGLLNFNLIGFHTFDYACHFLSCCVHARKDLITSAALYSSKFCRLEYILNLHSISFKLK